MNFKFKITQYNHLNFFVEHYKMIQKHVGNNKLVLYKTSHNTYALSFILKPRDINRDVHLFFAYDYSTNDLGLFSNPAAYGYWETDNTEFNLLVLEKMDND